MPVLGGEATSASASSFMIDGKLYDTGNDEKTCEQACEILFDDVGTVRTSIFLLQECWSTVSGNCRLMLNLKLMKDPQFVGFIQFIFFFKCAP